MAYCVDGVSDVVAEDLLVVAALEQVVSIWIQRSMAVVAWVG